MGEIMEKLEQIRCATLIGAKDTLTVEECALLTGYSEATLYGYTSRREIPHFKRGNKIYFSKSEVEAWMRSTPVPTVDESKSQAATYVAIKELNKTKKQ